MNEVPDSFDPLEQWKEDYNRDGTAPLEALSHLAHMSRFIAGYQARSTDAHLALFGLTRDPGYLYLAVQVAGGNLDDAIAAAIPLFSSALTRAEPGTRWYLALQRGQAIVLHSRATETSDVDDLRVAADALVELLAAIPPDDRERASYTAALANGRRRIAQLTGDDKTLADALADFEAAVADFPPAQQGYAELVRDAARTAAEVATSDAVPEDDVPELFGRALTLFEQAAGSDAELRPGAAEDVASLAYVYLQRWRDEQRDDDLRRSIQAWGVAATLSENDAARLIDNLNNLVATLQEGRAGRDTPGLLDEQISALGQLAELVPDGDPRRTLYRELEAAALQERYRSYGRDPDLERLVLLSGADLSESEPGSPERTARASDHAYFLLHRFYRDRDQGDLNEAIAVLEEGAPDKTAPDKTAPDKTAPDKTPADKTPAADVADAVRARWLSLAGSALLERYSLWGMRQLDELARAREYFERAVALSPPGTLTRVEALRGLAAATEFFFQMTVTGVGDRDLPVMLLEEALDQLDAESVYAPVVRQDLANRLLQRAASGREQPADLDRAIDLLQRTVSAGQGGFAAAGLRLSLADALRKADERDARPGARARAIAEYRASLPARLETNVDDALGGAARWGAWAAERRSWAEAAEAFTLAVQAIDEIYLANVGIGSTVWLRRAPGLAAEAAYAFARAGRPGDSALVLEAARFRAGSESLALVRADLGDLSRTGHGDLAGRLRDSSARWRRVAPVADASPPSAGEVSLSISLGPLREAAGLAAEPGSEGIAEPGSVPDGVPSGRSGDVDRSRWEATGRTTRQARKEFEDTVAAIRQVPGFERFLDEPTLSDITAVSSRLPVVYLASCNQGGLAVALQPGRPPQSLFLRGLRRSRLDAELERFQKAYQGREADPGKWRAQLSETTRWLWGAMMERVLSLLSPSTQVLLVPTGTLGVLPLHAAWRSDPGAATGRRYACDQVVISYAPNARSAGAVSVASDGNLLAVADPAPLPAPLAPITFAEPEVAAAAAWFPAATVLRREEATATRVRQALAHASVSHLACHGWIDLREPRLSALVLSGGQPLTLRQVLDLRLSGHGDRLAVLTACETALSGTTLPDEVISLPGALLQAGFTGAVATQWAVPGLPAALLTARFYQHWKQDNWDWPTSLAAAQRWLRDSTDGEKAEFVHPRTGTPAVPVTARRPLWRALARRDPAGHSFAHVADWAAYTYVGGAQQASASSTGA